MKFFGRLACLLAVFGLLSQLLASPLAALLPERDHSAVASNCGDCSGESNDSHCPAEPLHDHCGSICSHFFTAIFQSADAFRARDPRALSLLAFRVETAPEGFPTGLFIPPKAS